MRFSVPGFGGVAVATEMECLCCQESDVFRQCLDAMVDAENRCIMARGVKTKDSTAQLCVECHKSQVPIPPWTVPCTQQLSLPAFKTLNETVLAQLIVFNKRREGEALHLTLEAFKKASSNPMNPIDVLIKWRDEPGEPAENPYLFARPGMMTNIHGSDCLWKYAEESKAEITELLRSTKLRKQAATLCQLLDLSWNKMQGSWGMTLEFTVTRVNEDK